MVDTLQPPLAPPRRGKRPRILGIARISGKNQDERSLADQEALLRRFLDDRLATPYDLEMIAARGKGEVVVRDDFLRAIELVETATFDLVVMEDLGRIARRIHSQLFCETAIDASTRVITLNDQIDTGREEWMVLAGFACMRHELYNSDTSKRIRRSLRNRFTNGGVLQRLIYGYVKPPGATTDAQVYKDPAAEPVYAEVFRLLDGGATYAEITDWLRNNGIPPGSACKSGRWTSANVSQWLHNSLIKGLRVRNARMAIRVNKTGKRKTVAAPPQELLLRPVPHLAFVEPGEYDRIMRKADRRNAKYGRKDGAGSESGALKAPTRRSPWPGGCLTCGVCGRRLVYGGHGQSDQLLCAGATDHCCWNGVTVNGPMAARKLGDAVLRAIAGLPDFDVVLAADFDKEADRLERDQDKTGRELAARVGKRERERDNLVQAIREGGNLAVLMAELRRVEADLQEAADRKSDHDGQKRRPVRRPSREELREKATAAFVAAAEDSAEFGRLLGRLLPTIRIWPVRLWTGGRSGPRAVVELDLATLLPETRVPAGLGRVLRLTITVNLFDAPEPEQLRAKVMELTAAKVKQRQIAASLNTHQATVQRAVA